MVTDQASKGLDDIKWEFKLSVECVDNKEEQEKDRLRLMEAKAVGPEGPTLIS
jgi:hypothetical protein